MEKKLRRPNQCDRIVDYIKEHGSITAAEAYEHLNILRLAARISEIKDAGHNVSMELVHGKTKDGQPAQWAKYRIIG